MTGESTDTWIKVLDGGNGAASRDRVDAMAIYRNYIYLATFGHSGPFTFPQIFRATLRSDTTWTNFTPGSGAGRVTDLRIFQDRLFVSLDDGQIWWLGADDLWRPLDIGWSGDLPVQALGILKPVAGGHVLCAARGQLEIWCGTTAGAWSQLTVPSEIASDSTIQEAKLHDFGHDLYLGIGGGPAGSRTCEVWKFTSVRFDSSAGTFMGEWENVTSDCFGNPALTWLNSMEVFTTLPNVWLFFGTGVMGIWL